MPKKTPASIAERLPVPIELIERRIYLIRGQKVMVDTDLAELYKVETRALNQAIRRNQDRFPGDFMFQLSPDEAAALRSQTVILDKAGGATPSTLLWPSPNTGLPCCLLSSTARAPCG
jgi:hypothetical protein